MADNNNDAKSDNALREFVLTTTYASLVKTQKKIYDFMVENHPEGAGITRIADTPGIDASYSNIYKTLDRMIEKGAITVIRGFRGRIFVPVTENTLDIAVTNFNREQEL